MKRVVFHAGPDEPDQTLAEFELDGDVVRAKYLDASFKRRVTEDGIWTVDTGYLHPADGSRFYDALEEAFANSSRVSVVTTDA